MSEKSFDLKTFAESLDLSSGLMKLARVEVAGDPNAVCVFAELSPEVRVSADAADVDTTMVAWVFWMPKHHLLRFSINLDLEEASDENGEFDLLAHAGNTLNCYAWDRISKVFVMADDDEKRNIGTSVFTLHVPPAWLATEQGVRALREVVSTNVARLFQEAVHVSVELHVAMSKAVADARGRPGAGKAN